MTSFLRTVAAVGTAFTFAACAAEAPIDDEASAASAQTRDAGTEAAASPDAGASDASAPLVPVPGYAMGENSGTPKLRFALDDAAPVDAASVTMPSRALATTTAAISGLTPVPGGYPALHVELGRQRAPLARGTYTCAAGEAVAVLVAADGTKEMSIVAGGAPRPCTFVVEDVLDFESGGRIAAQKVVGRFEATVGARDDVSAPTTLVRGAFAGVFVVSSN